MARRGSYIARGAILMPSYVNIGAYVGEGTMVDTWATVALRTDRRWRAPVGSGISGALDRCRCKSYY